MTEDMTGAQLTLLITSVVGFLGTAFGFLGQWLTARRNRKWELENRRLEAEERERERVELVQMAEAKAEALIIEAKALADAVAIKAAQSVKQIELGLARVGASAHKAYEEANHVNLKIEQLNERLLAAEDDKTATATDKKLDQVIATGDSIEGKVDKLGGK